MTVVADCEKPSDPKVTRTPAMVAASKTNRMTEAEFELRPNKRNHLEKSSVAQNLGGKAV